MSNELLNELNAFRTNEGKTAFADWRKARHMPMLEQYRAAAAAEFAKHNETVPATPTTETVEKLPAYKVLARQSSDKSTIEKPVEFIHAFLNEHPDMKRKAAIAALVHVGINYSTARTQYQKWFSARKG